jgi:hypothetical protein
MVSLYQQKIDEQSTWNYWQTLPTVIPLEHLLYKIPEQTLFYTPYYLSNNPTKKEIKAFWTEILEDRAKLLEWLNNPENQCSDDEKCEMEEAGLVDEADDKYYTFQAKVEQMEMLEGIIDSADDFNLKTASVLRRDNPTYEGVPLDIIAKKVLV